jgi:hypothetical protein
MKTGLCIIAAALIAALGWHFAGSENPSDHSDPSDRSDRPHPAALRTDPATVFEKAFWKRPSNDDRILHAERREWKDASGISKWQWFITVEPSKALLDHLITQNAFSLTPAKNTQITPEAPKWFPSSKASFEAFTNASGTFTIFWDKARNILHATDSGRGFRPGAPAPSSAPLASQQPAGRLPSTPPPKP